MRATSIKHYGLAVAVIALVGLLSTAAAEASPQTYNDPEFSFDRVPVTPSLTGDPFPVGDVLLSPDMTVAPFDNAAATYAFYRSGLTDFTANAFASAEVWSGGTAKNPAEPTIGGANSLPRELRVGLTLAEAAVSSLSRSVPQRGALILSGLGLVALAFGMRRITGRKESDSEEDGQALNLLISAEREAVYREPALGEPAAPLFHQTKSGRNDTISLSQHS